MVHIYYGNEPYLIERAKRKILSGISCDMNLKSVTEWNEEIYEFLMTYPFMDEKKGVYLDVDSLSKIDCASFRKIITDIPDFSELFVLVRKFDGRTKYANELKKFNVLHKTNKLEKEEDLIKYVLYEVNSLSGKITQDALNELLRRENYFEAEITLLDVVSDLCMLTSISKEITLSLVEKYVRENKVDNCFAIANMILSKNVKGLKNEADLTPKGEEIKVLSLLMREYRLAWKNHLSKVSGRVLFKELPIEKCLDGLKICMSSIDSIKNGSIPAENVLFITFSKLLDL